MAFVLPRSRYDDIRRAVDPMLDDEAIPDDTIESAVYLGAAERWAKATDVAWASRVADEQESLYLAIIYYTAGLLSPQVPQAKQVNMAGHNATITYGETAKERTARLLASANDAITPLITVADLAAGSLIFVTTVSGQRG